MVLIVGACSHSSNEGAATPTSFETELVISPTLVTLSDAEWERVVGERDREIEDSREPLLGFSLEFIPNYGFTPGAPEWNTAVIREAAELQDRIISFNKCRSLDAYYDFKGFSTGPIEKITEINLRYVSGLLFILRWNFIEDSLEGDSSSAVNFDAVNLSEEEQIEFKNAPRKEREAIENFSRFYEEVRVTLADIIGNTSL